MNRAIAATNVVSSPALGTPLLASLERVAAVRGAAGIEARIAELRGFLGEDLAAVESGLSELAKPQGDEAIGRRSTPMHASALRLVAAGGKRLRPLCVALAAHLGTGFSEKVRDLAIAAELVHSATLLHDDVVDLGAKRRGLEASRVIYGNAASIFAGDWLLVEALTRVTRSGMNDVLDRALIVLGEMLEAEALQLARRGKVSGTVDDYLAVARGKTASLFRWAMFAGARAGGLDASSILALERFGEQVGVAFQIVDDVLDVEGEAGRIGKNLFADLREGKLTLPLIKTLEKDTALRDEISAYLEREGELLDADLLGRTARAMRDSGALRDARAWARDLIDRALEDLRVLPACPARWALEGVADTIVTRSA